MAATAARNDFLGRASGTLNRIRESFQLRFEPSSRDYPVESEMVQRYSPWPHRVAVLLFCATFPLIWLGGLVTTYDAGMAVPDWPTTYGYNLFAYPWKTWLFGPFDLLIEHGHRLLAATVGLVSIVLVALVYLLDGRRVARIGAITLFSLVLSQGLLGGARVVLDERTLALIHACFGMPTFAFAAGMMVLTSRYWHRYSGKPRPLSSQHQRLLRVSIVTVGLVYLQVVLGALVRHVPIGASPFFFRVAVLFHVAVGLAVLAHVVMLMLRAFANCRSQKLILRPVVIIGMLVVVQISLGAATWVFKYGWPSPISDMDFAAGMTIQANSMAQAMVTTAHVALGASILAIGVVIAMRAWRVLGFDVVPTHLESASGSEQHAASCTVESFSKGAPDRRDRSFSLPLFVTLRGLRG